MINIYCVLYICVCVRACVRACVRVCVILPIYCICTHEALIKDKRFCTGKITGKIVIHETPKSIKGISELSN